MSKFETVNLELEKVTNTMKNNIEDLLSREEKLQELENKSDQLNEQSSLFKSSSEDLKRKKCIENMKTSAGVASIVGIFLFIILYPIIGKK